MANQMDHKGQAGQHKKQTGNKKAHVMSKTPMHSTNMQKEQQGHTVQGQKHKPTGRR